jgi:hypothetical protein
MGAIVPGDLALMIPSRQPELAPGQHPKRFNPRLIHTAVSFASFFSPPRVESM